MERWPAEVCCTLNAAFGKKLGLENQHVNGGCPAFVDGEAGIRRLTVEEIESLMGFPPGYTAVGARPPEGPRYKALGNSMATSVMSWVGARIQEVDTLVKEGGQDVVA